MEKDVGNYHIDSIKGKKIAIACPTQEEWDKVSEVAGIEWGSARWDIYSEDSCINVNNSNYSQKRYYKENGYTIISASEFLADNSPSTVHQYSVGDWVVITRAKDISSANREKWVTGQCYQVGGDVSSWDDGGARLKDKDGKYTGDGYMKGEDIRPALSHEIPSQEYTIGEWVTCIDNPKATIMRGSAWVLNRTFQVGHQNKACSEQCVYPNKKDPGVFISHLRRATPEEIAKATQTSSVQPIRWKIGDIVIVTGTGIGSGNGIWPDSSLAKCKIVEESTGGGHILNIYDKFAHIEILEGNQKGNTFRTKVEAIIGYAELPTQSQVPVTTENAYIGMRVVRGKDWDSLNSKKALDAQDSNGTAIGTIKGIEDYRKGWATVDWDNGKTNIVYRIGDGDKYDLYIHSNSTSQTSKSINNKSNNLKTSNNEKSDSSSGSIYSKRPHIRRDIKAVTSTEGGEIYSAGCKIKSYIVEEVYRKDEGCIRCSKGQKGRYIG